MTADLVTERSRQTKASARRAHLQRELDRWLPLLIAHERPEKVILFGSCCEGDITEWSDVDLVIIKETQAPFLERTRRILELLCPRVGVDVLVYTPTEYEHLSRERPFVHQEIATKGKVIYERRG